MSVLPRIAERDHPREYGENSYSLAETQADLWIIPANTGRMKCHCLSTQGTRDHPREYGENVTVNLKPLGGKGSSPRIRGECDYWEATEVEPGIIPANTGRIPLPQPPVGAHRDHPREYGENLLPDRQVRAGRGIIPANTGRILADLRKPDQQD